MVLETMGQVNPDRNTVHRAQSLRSIHLEKSNVLSSEVSDF